MYELQETRRPQMTGVIKEDLYAPVVGIIVGGVIATVGLANTASRIRKGEGLRARDAIGAAGGFVALASLAKADQLTSLMLYQEMTQGYMQE